jgi:hypothetical protein
LPVQSIRAGGSFLAGDQAGDCGQDRVEVLASAEVSGQGSSVLQVADAVLDADSLRRVSSAFALVCRGEGGTNAARGVGAGHWAATGR